MKFELVHGYSQDGKRIGPSDSARGVGAGEARSFGGIVRLEVVTRRTYDFCQISDSSRPVGRM